MNGDAVERARKLLAAGTDGGWYARQSAGTSSSWAIIGVGGPVALGCNRDDAALIAAAPGLLEELANEVEHLRQIALDVLAEMSRPEVCGRVWASSEWCRAIEAGAKAGRVERTRDSDNGCSGWVVVRDARA